MPARATHADTLSRPTQESWLHQRMLAERCRLQAKQILVEPAVGLPLILLISMVLLPDLGSDQILPWALLLAFTFLLRTLAASRFLTRRLRANVLSATNVFNLTSGLSGLLIGASAGLYFPQIGQVSRLGITIVIFAWLAASVLLHAAFARHALLHLATVLIQVAVAWALVPDTPGLMIAAGVAAYGALIIRLSSEVSRTLGETIRRRFQLRGMAQRLARQREQAERARHDALSLRAAASHDLRQPATSLGLLSSLIKERCDDPALSPLISGIARSASTLNELLSSLLDLSRLQSGAVTVQREWLAVHEIFDALRQEFEERAREQGLSLLVSPAPIVVYSDRVLLARMLRNLLENALRYTDQGAITLAASAGDGCTLSVTDTGIGIPPDQLERVFQDHVRLTTPGRKSVAGLGLGLPIVRRIADLLAIKIDARSDGKRGSRFELQIDAQCVSGLEQPPAQALQEAADSGHTSMRLAPDSTDSLPAKGNVLVVDDDPDVGQAVAQVLRARGWSVVYASSVREAFDNLAGSRSLDSLITDIRMGGSDDGLSLAIAARLLRPGLSCLLLTADTSSDLRRRVSEHQFSLLTKPITPQALAEALQNPLFRHPPTRSPLLR